VSKTFDMRWNTGEANRFVGSMKQMALTINSAQHAGHLAEYVAGELGEHFNDYLDLAARAEGGVDSLHHVYEWNMAGLEQARLWRIKSSGRGRERDVSFSWRASKTTVPIPDIPAGPQGQQLKQIHVFVWKAPIMEYDLRVHIEPKRGEWLAIPTGDPDRPLWFTKSLHGVQSKFSPGGNKTTGQFTAHWAAWWGGDGADIAFDQNLAPRIEADPSETKMFVKIRLKRGNKAVKIQTVADVEVAEREGRQMATEFLRARDREYIRDAERRAVFFGDGGEEFE
jgi:hypothetical protein